jgi:hypothetical protein
MVQQAVSSQKNDSHLNKKTDNLRQKSKAVLTVSKVHRINSEQNFTVKKNRKSQVPKF